MDQWLAAMILGYLAQARETGDVTTTVPDDAIAGHLLNMLLGAQITAALAPGAARSELGLNEQLEGFLTQLGCQARPGHDLFSPSVEKR